MWLFGALKWKIRWRSALKTTHFRETGEKRASVWKLWAVDRLTPPHFIICQSIQLKQLIWCIWLEIRDCQLQHTMCLRIQVLSHRFTCIKLNLQNRWGVYTLRKRTHTPTTHSSSNNSQSISNGYWILSIAHHLHTQSVPNHESPSTKTESTLNAWLCREVCVKKCALRKIRLFK